MDANLGRLISEDPQDNNYPMGAVLESNAGLTYRYWWADGWWGNQFYTPQCVAYSWLHWLEDGPYTHAPFSKGSGPKVDPQEVYDEAQAIDEWPGTDYDGTSVRAGAKILQRYGFIKEYRWGRTIDEVVTALLTTGPVVFGTYWYGNMFYPDQDGLIDIGGESAGGHAYLLDGVNTNDRIIRIKNSWGRDWGKNGFAYITFDDASTLLNQYGEACLAIEQG